MSEASFDERLGQARAGERGRRVVVWLLGALVLVLLAGLVAQQLFMWSVVPGPERAIEALVLLALSSVILLLFVIVAFVLVRNLIKLRRERRENRFGSRLKTRLVTYFIALSLLPITAMALFSYTFLNRSLEKWFGSFPQDIVSQARESQKAGRERERERVNATAIVLAHTVAPSVTRPMTNEAQSYEAENIDTLVSDAGLAAARVFAVDGTLIAKGLGRGITDERATELLAVAERDPAMQRTMFDGIEHVVARATNASGVYAVAARELREEESLSRIVLASERFEQLRLSQRWVRGVGLTTLALLTLLVLFALTWTADHLARSIVAPLRELAEAADEVARGNLAHRVSEIADDELAQLAASFNSMTHQLEESRRRVETTAGELNSKNAQLEERRSYIEVVLASLSTGVVSLDEDDRVTTANRAALRMLRFADGRIEEPPRTQNESASDVKLPCGLRDLASAEDAAALERVVRRARRAGRATEQTSLVRTHAKPDSETGEPRRQEGDPSIDESGVVLPVALSATALQPGDEEVYGERCGVVVVMEDLSELLAAQRAAAWSEIARRMAHEIKNPLTPIQLSAERIARQFRRVFGTETDGETIVDNSHETNRGAEDQKLRRVIEEGTEAITREVTSLKSMVDEFARFAQLPGAQLAPGDLNQVVDRALKLYDVRLADLRLDVRLANNLPVALVDAEQLRRVFVNLLENATEAVSDTDGDRRITVATGFDSRRGVLLAEVADNGHGIRPSDYPRLFQPYFSTRNRGTGLGLAIVHRIITDHGGRITVEPNFPRGARFRLEIPVPEERMKDEGGRMKQEENDLAVDASAATASSFILHPSSL